MTYTKIKEIATNDNRSCEIEGTQVKYVYFWSKVTYGRLARCLKEPATSENHFASGLEVYMPRKWSNFDVLTFLVSVNKNLTDGSKFPKRAEKHKMREYLRTIHRKLILYYTIKYKCCNKFHFCGDVRFALNVDLHHTTCNLIAVLMMRSLPLSSIQYFLTLGSS